MQNRNAPHYHCELEKLDPDVIIRLEKENVFVIRDGSFSRRRKTGI